MEKMINTMAKIYRREIFLTVLASVFFIWSVTSTFIALRNKPKITIIGIDKSGAHVIENEQQVRASITTIFIRHFLVLFYSHDKFSFSNNTDLATNLMSEALFNKIKIKISDNQKEVEKYSQVAEVHSVSLIDSNKYQALVRMRYIKDTNESSEEFKIVLSIQESQFIEENPWGYEITSIEERRIN